MCPGTHLAALDQPRKQPQHKLRRKRQLQNETESGLQSTLKWLVTALSPPGFAAVNDIIGHQAKKLQNRKATAANLKDTTAEADEAKTTAARVGQAEAKGEQDKEEDQTGAKARKQVGEGR